MRQIAADTDLEGCLKNESIAMALANAECGNDLPWKGGTHCFIAVGDDGRVLADATVVGCCGCNAYPLCECLTLRANH